MAAALRQLMMLLIRDQGAVDVLRFLPAEGLVQTRVLRSRRKILVAAHHMGDSHQMVIDHVGEVVGRKAVGLDQDHVVQFGVRDRDVAVQGVGECRRAFVGGILTDHEGHSRSQIRFDLLFRQVQAVLIVDHDLLAVDHLLQGFKTLLAAEAVICLALFDEDLRIFHVNAGGNAFALYVRADASVLVGTFVVDKSGLLQRAVNDIDGAFYLAFLVGIFNAQQKIASFVLGNEVGVKSGS